MEPHTMFCFSVARNTTLATGNKNSHKKFRNSRHDTAGQSVKEIFTLVSQEDCSYHINMP
jgi:hypothetical protein